MSARRYSDEQAKSGVAARLPDIECFPSAYRGFEIAIENPEYTAVCPKTGLPDFGTIRIRYEPDRRCAELKSLKEYFLAYRGLGIFYESAVNKILEDFVAAVEPVWAEVTGDFSARGGMRSVLVARSGKVPGAPTGSATSRRQARGGRRQGS